MTSIRKIKRRTMQRMSYPVVELRLPTHYFEGMTHIQRDNFIREAMRHYLKSPPPGDGAKGKQE